MFGRKRRARLEEDRDWALLDTLLHELIPPLSSASLLVDRLRSGRLSPEQLATVNHLRGTMNSAQVVIERVRALKSMRAEHPVGTQHTSMSQVGRVVQAWGQHPKDHRVCGEETMVAENDETKEEPTLTLGPFSKEPGTRILELAVMHHLLLKAEGNEDLQGLLGTVKEILPDADHPALKNFFVVLNELVGDLEPKQGGKLCLKQIKITFEVEPK